MSHRALFFWDADDRDAVRSDPDRPNEATRMGTNPGPPGPGPSPPGATRGETWHLVAVFGLLSFLQGFGEPTEGLSSQPVRTLLLRHGYGAGRLATFSAVLALPWALKPFLGLLTDFLPLGGSRRKGYLVAAGATAAVAFLAPAVAPGGGRSAGGLLAWLFVATLALTLADVTTDALVVDWGKAHGRTGRYQAAQWFCLYASGVVTGTAGGILSERGRTGLAFLLCAGAMTAMLVLASFVREPVRAVAPARPTDGGRSAGRSVLAVAAFLILVNFHPFSSTILHVHMTGALGLGERFFGDTLSVFALTAMAASAVYGVIAPRLPMRVLAHASVALGVVGILAYGAMDDRRSAVIVTVVVGFTWMTSTLVQFELAARACPPSAAGTVFAALMAVSNLSTALATWLGGAWYDAAGAAWGRPAAFRVMIAAGATFAAGGWLLIPWFPDPLLGPQAPGEP